MRKDVRFGLSIGGILVLVLVVWVVVADHFGPKPIPSDVAIQPAPSPDETAAPQPDVGPQTQPVLTEAPAATTQPAASPSQNWDAVLASGEMPRASASDPTTQPLPLSVTVSDADVPATQPAARTTARTHKVTSGESFYTIAASAYGDGSLFNRIEDANPNVDPKRLRVGTVLNIPDMSDAPRAQAPAPVMADVDSAHTYRVQSSDTLVKISRKLYGNSSTWQKIYDLNRDEIGDNPGRLKVGTVLRLPESPTVASR
jgi:nucleoid-associated protein YgaU